MFLIYEIEGTPVPQGSFRHIGQGRIIAANPKLNQWRETIANQIRQQGHPSPIEAPIKVSLEFVLPRPKTVTRKHPITRSSYDVDKLIRAVFDAISLEKYAQVIKDDSQIISVKASKRYESSNFKPGVQIYLNWEDND
jgi:Holliday junction resolvase RusA-like endonuclease